MPYEEHISSELRPGQRAVLELHDTRNRCHPVRAIAERDTRGRVSVLLYPRPGDTHTAATYLHGRKWGNLAGPVLVWAANNPELLAAFTGPPFAIVYLES